MKEALPQMVRNYEVDRRHVLPAFRDAVTLAALGLTVKKHRSQLVRLGRSIRQQAFEMRDEMPSVKIVELSKFLGCNETKELVIPPLDVIVEGGLGYVELYGLLATVVSAVQPRKIMEVGTFRGVSSLTMALNAPEAEIYTFDLPDEVEGTIAEGLTKGDKACVEFSRGYKGAAFLGHPVESRIHAIRADSLKMDVRDYMDSADFCFIDGGHSYECIKADTENAFKVLSPRGVILWDDYSWYLEGVGQYLTELAKTQPLWHIAGTNSVIYRRD